MDHGEHTSTIYEDAVTLSQYYLQPQCSGVLLVGLLPKMLLLLVLSVTKKIVELVPELLLLPRINAAGKMAL